jgi:lysozyme
MRTANEHAIALAKSYETLKLTTYDDGAGYLTIGYGHISDKKYKVLPGTTITKEFAEELFLYDLAEATQLMCNELAHEEDLSDNEYSALVDLAFNSGSMKIKKDGKWVPSDLMNALNEHNFQIAGELIKTHDIYAGGKILKGLKRRRLAEYFLYTGFRVGELKPTEWAMRIRIEADRLIP